MSYRDYVIAAYAVFAVFLLWDFLVPRLQIRAALRAVRRRLARQASAPTPTELHR
ncbi:heme exporter protein CcmD [Thermomonas sp.]|jgi:heme exporter protein D|uniref:heme exporter protein CcmD n=1 Tax=Thermomonas sp. TaxID=1971895 RepID=UPI001AC6BBCA|nr:heme exporter protein CcmD [Xanthomonadales bacterium]MBN8794277.1 heme exporter protein CcmD [Stenotrophomonas nitritireducens]